MANTDQAYSREGGRGPVESMGKALVGMLRMLGARRHCRLAYGDIVLSFGDNAETSFERCDPQRIADELRRRRAQGRPRSATDAARIRPAAGVPARARDAGAAGGRALAARGVS